MTTISPRPEIHIGKVIRNAVTFNFKPQSEELVNTGSFPQMVASLFNLLHERRVAYVLVGGIVLLRYIEGRNTEDIDLIMAMSSVKKLPEIQIVSQNVNFARGKFDELQIDILLTRNPLFEQVQKHYTTIQHFTEQDIPCATVEGLLLLKLYMLPSLYREENFARVGIYENDIATLLHAYHPALEPLLKELAHYLNETDVAAVREVVAEIQQRLDRFGKGLSGS